MSIPYAENLNYGRFETWTQKPQRELVQVHQTHSNIVVGVKELPCEADGIAVSLSELDGTLAIKTADCLPVVIEGRTGVIFIHAGWRGLANGILEHPRIAEIEPVRVLIGPSIHECCFEVSEDFKDNFPESPHFHKSEGRLYFNLQLEARDILKKSFPRLLIEIAPVCTCCDEKLHSYRRNKTKERNWNLYIKG